MLEILGVTERQGNYEGNDYHNVYLHCCNDNPDAVGKTVEQVKIRASDVMEVFGFGLNKKKAEELLGKKIRVYYNRFGVVIDVEFEDWLNDWFC